jgi:hypothetical protein
MVGHWQGLRDPEGIPLLTRLADILGINLLPIFIEIVDTILVEGRITASKAATSLPEGIVILT